MHNRANLKVLFSSLIAGLVLGYIGGPAQILTVWGAVGAGIGYFSPTFRLSVLSGAIFGFIAAFVFMLHGYNGTDPIASKLLPFAVIGAFGSVCGIILAVVGKLLRKSHSGIAR